MKLQNNQFRSRVRYQVWRPKLTIRDLVCGLVQNQVWCEIYIQVYNRIDDRIRNQIRDQLQ